MGVFEDLSHYVERQRPEWWSPSEHCKHHPTIRLSRIEVIDRSRPGYKDNLILISVEAQSYDLHYDSAEHRDEDFERLKLALGVE